MKPRGFPKREKTTNNEGQSVLFSHSVAEQEKKPGNEEKKVR